MGELKKVISANKLKAMKDESFVDLEDGVYPPEICSLIICWLLAKYLRFLGISRRETMNILQSNRNIFLTWMCFMLHMASLFICLYTDKQLCALLACETVLSMLIHSYRDGVGRKTSRRRQYLKARGHGMHETLDYRCRCQRPRSEKPQQQVIFSRLVEDDEGEVVDEDDHLTDRELDITES
ncbi:hypothetical protein SK128_019170 [Halocaridina rubra]|uniref:Uncharacterized protein n=1 Tax=Halocaridina rubra TaxID=373956 RepID=A0AAN8WEN1_HALRR